MDFEKYKPRLKEYLRSKGVDVSINPTHCFNGGAHKHGDANPSCQIEDNGYKCFGCGIAGDIYDAVELLEGITDKNEQYKFVEKLFGNGWTPPPAPPASVWGKEGEEFAPDKSGMDTLENYLRKNVAAEKEIKRFLSDRANYSTNGAVDSYPDDALPFLIEQLFYWPGLDIVIQDIGRETLKKCGVPLVNPNTQHSTWEHSGVVMKLGTGYKLHYYEKKYCDKCKETQDCPDFKKGGFCHVCEKRTSKGGKTFPMPLAIDKALPVVLVEGEMNALSCAAIGIKNLFSTGGTNGLTGPKVKTYLLEVPEIILFFDSDEAGRKASGLDPLTEADKRKSNIPQIILRAGFTGKLKLAELPPVSETGCKDQDALILAGKREVIEKTIKEAKDYVPTEAPPKQKKQRTFESYAELSIKRLKCLLRKVKKDKLEKDDVQPFISACVKAFSGKDTFYTLKTWGASQQEINAKNDVAPVYLLKIAEKYLSRYMMRQLRRELTPTSEILKNITIQNTSIELDFEELDINENARNFAHYGGIRSAALMLADIFDGKIIFDAAKNEKQFYFFDGHIWKHEPDITGVVYNALLRVIHHFLKLNDTSESDEEAKKKERARLLSVFNDIEERRLRIEIQHEFAGLKNEGVYHNSDNKEDELSFDGTAIRETITLLDGVMDFSGKTIEYRAARQEEYRRSVLPYTVEAVKKSIFPEKFMAFMKGNFKDAATLETLMYYLSLIPSRTQYKYGAFWIGGKNTGKSTTIKILEAIYKHIVGAMDADVLVPKGKTFATGNGPTPYLSRLQGIGASIISETEDGATLNAGLWKKLTGDDTITARGLNEAPKEFRNTAQIIISTNDLPKFDRHDEAVITRMVVIPFLISHERDAKETKQWKDVLAELEPEFPAVIRLFAEYYIKLKNTLGGIIPISKESELYKLGYIAEVETDLDKYINACITFDGTASEVIKRVYESYKDYYEFDDASVKRGEALSQHRFSRLLLKNYKEKISDIVKRVDGKPARCFVGLKLKPVDEITERTQVASDNSAKETWGGGGSTAQTKTDDPVEENPFK